FTRIVRAAFHEVAKKQKTAIYNFISINEWFWYQKAAFRELVLLGIITYMQLLSVNWIRNSSRVKDPYLLFTQACKENIDRGCKTNAELLWGLSPLSASSIESVFASLHSRALLGRARLIHPHRYEAIYALMLVMDQASVHQFLMQIIQ